LGASGSEKKRTNGGRKIDHASTARLAQQNTKLTAKKKGERREKVENGNGTKGGQGNSLLKTLGS